MQHATTTNHWVNLSRYQQISIRSINQLCAKTCSKYFYLNVVVVYCYTSLILLLKRTDGL